MTRRQKYFLMQKLVGLAIAILSIVVALVVGEGAVGAFGVLVGLGLIFTESKVLMIGDYYSGGYGSYRR